MSTIKLYAVLFLMTAAVFCVSAAEDMASLLKTSDITEILKRGYITVGIVNAERPPFIYKQKNGEYTGFEIVIAREIAKEIGVQLKINSDAKSFDELIEITGKGEADFSLSKLSRTLERSKIVIFSDPYITLHRAMLLNRLDVAKRRGDSTIQEYIKRIDGKIGIIKGSSYAKFAVKMFPKAELIEYENWDLAIKDVTEGKITAVFRDEFEIKSAAKSIPGASLHLQSVVFTDTLDPISAAITPTRPHLCYWINQFILTKQLKTDADSLLSKTNGKAIGYELSALEKNGGNEK